LRRNPLVNELLEHGERHRAALEHDGVEVLQVELRPQCRAGTVPQLENLQLADLVGN